jgi:hypothetical protein
MKYDSLSTDLANYTIFNSSVDIEANLMKKQGDITA